MLNKTTNQATSIGITNPNNVTSIGATAEWIVEGVSSILPVFSTVVFQNCSGGTKDHAFNLTGGVITEITGSGGANLTAAAIHRPTNAWSNGSSPVRLTCVRLAASLLLASPIAVAAELMAT